MSLQTSYGKVQALLQVTWGGGAGVAAPDIIWEGAGAAPGDVWGGGYRCFLE